MDISELFNTLRETLRPSGTAPVVSLKPITTYGFYDSDFVNAVIDHLETRVMMAEAGLDELTPSDKLALSMLLDAAGIKRGQ